MHDSCSLFDLPSSNGGGASRKRATGDGQIKKMGMCCINDPLQFTEKSHDDHQYTFIIMQIL